MKSCSVPGCDRARKRRGWCYAHFSRWYRAGTEAADIPIATRDDYSYDDDQLTLVSQAVENDARALLPAVWQAFADGAL